MFLMPYAGSGLSQQIGVIAVAITTCISSVVGITVQTLFWYAVHKTVQLVPVQKRIYSNTLIWWIVGCIAVSILINLLTSLSGHTTLGLIFALPFSLIVLVLSWMFLLIGVPRALRNTVSDNVEALCATSTLKNIGLWYLILNGVLFFTSMPEILLITKSPASAPVFALVIIVLKSPVIIAVWVLWIIYWVKIVGFRKKYLTQVGKQ